VVGISQRIIKTRCVTSRLLLKARATSSAMGICARNVPRRWQREAMVLRLARGSLRHQRLKRGNKVGSVIQSWAYAILGPRRARRSVNPASVRMYFSRETFISSARPAIISVHNGVADKASNCYLNPIVAY
jgi:hypothetical protein